jgi:hypothetical protein
MAFLSLSPAEVILGFSGIRKEGGRTQREKVLRLIQDRLMCANYAHVLRIL